MTDFEYMKEALTTEVVMMLIDNSGIDIKSALDCFYNSETYAKLSIPESGLFFQSPGYVYSFLATELSTGKIG